MTIQNGETYENNYARAAACLLGSCAARPEGGARQAAYDLITGIYAAVAGNAEKIGFRPVDDVYFAPWEQQHDRKKDVWAIRDAIDKVESLTAELYRLSVLGELCAGGLRLPQDAAKPKRTLIKALLEAGIAMKNDTLLLPEGCAEGLKKLAEISRAHTIPITDGPTADKEYLYFSRCVFTPSANWTAAAFDGLLAADGRLLRLCDALERRGYRRIDCRDGKKISLDYVKRVGKGNTPVKASWADKAHAGIEVSFEELRLEPCFIWLRIPMFKVVLERMDELPDRASAFIERHTKTCDGCRYCVQTDKTRTRPLAAVSVNGRKKCPHFAAFTMNWRSLSAELAGDMLAVLDAVERLGL